MNISVLQKIISFFIIFITGYLYISVSKKITPSLFISNVYLYVALSIALSCVIILQLSKHHYTLTNTHLFMIFIISLSSIIGVRCFQNNILRHFILFLFIISVSFMIYPIYESTSRKETLNSAIMTTIIITLVLSIYSSYSTLDFLSWRSYLMFGLLALIVLEFGDIIFHSSFQGLTNRFKIYSGIAVVLFSAFILHDTQILKKRSTNINVIKDVNYPSESMSLFLDIVNLFTNVSNIV